MADFGRKTGHVMYLDCDSPFVPNVPLMHRGGGVVRSEPVGSEGIAPNAVLGSHLKGLDHVFFGLNGSGAEAVFDGTATVLGLAPSSSVYTLTADISVRVMRVSSGVTIKANGYRIFAQSLTLAGTAVIHNDGTSGSNGQDAPSSSTAGTGGGGQNGGGTGTVGGGVQGQKGGDGVAGVGTPGAGAASTAPTSSLGGNGGASGSGGTGDSGGGAAAAGSTASLTVAQVDNIGDARAMLDTTVAPPVRIRGGAAGSSGGGGAAKNGGSAGAGGGGGGGAGGGGVVVVYVASLDITGWTGRISANGGNGGNGGAAWTGSLAGSGGGAGGGGGGSVVLVVRTITGGGISSGYYAPGSGSSFALGAGTVSASGGAAGVAGTGGGANAGNGSVGTAGSLVIINMSQPPDIFTADPLPPHPMRPQYTLPPFRHFINKL